MMNGTAVMTGLACLAFARAEYLRASGHAHHRAGVDRRCAATRAISTRACSRPSRTRARGRVAACIAHGSGALRREPTRHSRLQDRYSIRCAPHVIGVLEDSLPTGCASFIETELNSANDNPLIDPEAERVLHGGHFYGGHIAFAMDSLKNLGGQRRRPDGPPVRAAGRRRATTTACRSNLSGATGRARRDQPRLEGRADRRLAPGPPKR